jgi:hypothetical protein
MMGVVISGDDEDGSGNEGSKQQQEQRLMSSWNDSSWNGGCWVLLLIVVVVATLPLPLHRRPRSTITTSPITTATLPHYTMQWYLIALAPIIMSYHTTLHCTTKPPSTSRH